MQDNKEKCTMSLSVFQVSQVQLIKAEVGIMCVQRSWLQCMGCKYHGFGVRGKGSRAAEHCYVLFKPYRIGGDISLHRRKAEMQMFQREVGYCLFIHLFISSFFLSFDGDQIFEEIQLDSFVLQAVLSHIISPVHNFMSICCFILFFLFICSFFVYCRIAMSWRRWTWKSVFW